MNPLLHSRYNRRNNVLPQSYGHSGITIVKIKFQGLGSSLIRVMDGGEVPSSSRCEPARMNDAPQPCNCKRCKGVVKHWSWIRAHHLSVNGTYARLPSSAVRSATRVCDTAILLFNSSSNISFATSMQIYRHSAFWRVSLLILEYCGSFCSNLCL